MRVRAFGVAMTFWAVGAFALPAPSIATPGEIVEFAVPTQISRPLGITAGPDGNLWFTESWPEAHVVGRITPAGQITEFPIPSSANLNSITAGPDGNVWFTDGLSSIGRITPAGHITEFRVPNAGGRQTRGIVAGPDGNLWFREVYPDAIGKVTTTGEFTEYPLPESVGHPIQLTAGPDGNVWFTLFEPDAIGRITPEGEITEFPVPTSGSLPHGITTGPDGNLWFTERDVDQIGRITPDGQIIEFPLAGTERGAEEIVAGPDGNLWFTEAGIGRIGRVTLDGEVDEFLIPTDNSVPGGIAVGPDGNLWFTEWLSGKIGRFTPGPPVPENFEPPTISGIAVQGETLFAASGSWTNEPISYAYRWQRCDQLGASCAPIAEADGVTYQLTSADLGHAIRVEVSAANDDGTGRPARSAATSVVTATPPEPPIQWTSPSEKIDPPSAQGQWTGGQLAVEPRKCMRKRLDRRVRGRRAAQHRPTKRPRDRSCRRLSRGR